MNQDGFTQQLHDEFDKLVQLFKQADVEIDGSLHTLVTIPNTMQNSGNYTIILQKNVVPQGVFQQ